MAYESSLIRSVVGNTIKVSHPVIPDNLLTFLTTSIVSGATTLTVLDNGTFAQNDYLVIGKIGLDKSEIQLISGAVSAGSSVSVNATTFDHSTDTAVAKILWNQVEISGATTVAGSKTVIATISIQADRSETTYVNTGTTYAFYFVRFKNSTTAVFSAYSSAAAAAGYATNTVRYAKDRALAMTNEKIGDVVTDDFLNQEVFNCEQEVFSEKKQWSWSYTFDKIIGQTAEGAYSVAMPTDIYDPNGPKNVLTVRIKDRPDMHYIDKEEWDRFFVLTRHTTVASTITIGDTSVTLTSTADFDSSGSIVIGADNAINYTANNTTTGVLSGVTGITANHSTSQDVWQSPQFAEPIYYTIFNNNLYFQAGCLSTYAGANIYMTYYRKPTAIATDADVLNIPDYTLYHYYLAWKILLHKQNGEASESSEKFRELYEHRKEYVKRQDRTGQKAFMRPQLNRIAFPRSETRTTFISTDTSG